MLTLDLFVPLFFLALTGAVAIGKNKFLQWTREHPYTMGAAKFGTLATLGSQLKSRIMAGQWQPELSIGQAAAWAVTGVIITLAFKIYTWLTAKIVGAQNIERAQHNWRYRLAVAFLTSLLMNATFALPMMAFHTYVETLFLTGHLAVINWASWLPFIAKTIVFFWIPAHTVTFCLKKELQVLLAAVWSIVLGMILAFAG